VTVMIRSKRGSGNMFPCCGVRPYDAPLGTLAYNLGTNQTYLFHKLLALLLFSIFMDQICDHVQAPNEKL